MSRLRVVGICPPKEFDDRSKDIKLRGQAEVMGKDPTKLHRCKLSTLRDPRPDINSAGTVGPNWFSVSSRVCRSGSPRDWISVNPL